MYLNKGGEYTVNNIIRLTLTLDVFKQSRVIEFSNIKVRLTLTLDVFKYDNKEIKEVLEQGLILNVFKWE